MALGVNSVPDQSQSIFSHYATYVNFMGVLFAVVFHVLNSYPSAINQLVIAAVAFCVNFAASFVVQQNSKGSIGCSKTRRVSCVFRIIFYITAILSPGILVFILAGQINWQPLMDIFRNINNLVFGETIIAAAPVIQEPIYQGIWNGVSDLFRRLTDQRAPPLLPVNLPPRTPTRWSSVADYGRRFVVLTKQIPNCGHNFKLLVEKMRMFGS